MDTEFQFAVQILASLYTKSRARPGLIAGPQFIRRAVAHRAVKRHASKLPTTATNTMITWLMNNIDRPYPSELQKKNWSSPNSPTYIGLTDVQINNWFSNARRRRLKKTRYSRPSKNALKIRSICGKFQ